MKKSLIIVTATACLLICVGTAVLVIQKDRTGPRIQITENNGFVYQEGADRDELLQGVTAIDEKDGDVSQSLVVESVKPSDLGDTAEITYAAMDKSHNVTKQKHTVQYQPASLTAGIQAASGEEAPQPEGDGQQEADPSANGQEASQALPTEPEPQPEADTQPMTDATEAAIAQLPAGSPQFRLNTHELILETGSEFAYMDYVQDITDDKDDRNKLYRQIQLRGEVDTSAPGTCELSYYVVDSDGNQSNVEVLTVTIR